jgi:alpha-L-rhamnosidase
LKIREDIEYYKNLSLNIKKAFNEEFFDEEMRVYAKDSQSALAMSLGLGLFPDGLEKDISKNLVDNIEKKWQGHLSTGIVGTYFLLKALGKSGNADIAYHVITKAGYPGYIQNLTFSDSRTPLGSTTLWEDWGGVSSHSHPVQGCVVSFFYEYLAGLQREESKPNFQNLIIEPAFISDLEWVKSTYHSQFGDIKINWKREKKGINLSLEIPCNTDAILILYKERYGTRLNLDSIAESELPISNRNDFEIQTEAQTQKKIKFGSGSYTFKIEFT